MLDETATRRNSSRRGTALVVVTVAMAGLAILSVTMLAMSSAASKQQRSSRDEIGAQYIAEAGLADAVFAMSSGATGERGSKSAPMSFGECEYWVEAAELGSGMTQLTATGIDGKSGSRIELVVRRTSTSFFSYGAFGDEQLTMDSQAMIDSYNSQLGPYEDQATNGSGSSAYANANGNTGSNGDITLKQNSKIYGDATPGVDGTTAVTGNAVVTGTTAPMPEAVELPPIELPVIASMGDLLVARNDTHHLISGEYRYENFNAGTGSELHVWGPATVVLATWDLDSGSEVIVHAEDGPVTFYVEGDFFISSNVTIASTTYSPGDLQINLLSDNVLDPDEDVDLDVLDFDSNSELYGTIYAPDAAIDIDSNFALFGAVIARRLHLDSNSRIHYDESLLQSGSEGGRNQYEAVAWRELSYSVR